MFGIAPAAAQESATLKKISTKKAIVLGVREGADPFSYLDAKQQYIGYSIDLCMKIVDAVKAQLKMPDLAVTMTKVTPQVRMQMLMAGDIDLECGSSTNSIERQKQVAFVVTTFFTGTRLLVKPSSLVRSYKDLKGKTVVVTTGTTNERAIKEYNLQESLGMKFVQVRDHRDALAAVEKGTAVAFPMDDVLLYTMRASATNPAEYAVVGEFLTDEPYAIMCGVPPDAAPNVSCPGRALASAIRSLTDFIGSDGWITITSGDTAISVTPTKSRTVS